MISFNPNLVKQQGHFPNSKETFYYSGDICSVFPSFIKQLLKTYTVPDAGKISQWNKEYNTDKVLSDAVGEFFAYMS